MLALDIYKQVIGQQNFQMGAVVSLILLLPAIVAFVVDRRVSRRQVAQMTARAVPYAPKDDKRRDRIFFGFCAAVSLLVTPDELAALSEAGRDVLRTKASAALQRHRPHYVIDTVADLPAVIAEIEARMARGERPATG